MAVLVNSLASVPSSFRPHTTRRSNLATVSRGHASPLSARAAVALCGAPAVSGACVRRTVANGRRSVMPIRALTVKRSYVDTDTPTGLMRTYIIQPTAPGKYPGIVFYSEIFQVTEPIFRSAQIMAGHGFIVTIPEIYHEFEEPGVAFSYIGTEGVDRGNSLKITKEIAAYDSDSKASVDFLSHHPDCTGIVGVMGFCIGGHLAFRAAMNEGVRAAACFYATDIHKGSLGKGMNDNSLLRVRELAYQGTEMLMIWGRQDPHVPTDGRFKVLQALNDAGVSFTWHEFNGQHAFMRDEGPRYDGELAIQCYTMCANLFRRKLNDGDLPVPSYMSASAGESRH